MSLEGSGIPVGNCMGKIYLERFVVQWDNRGQRINPKMTC